MKYLVDANILSEATKPRPATAVFDWLQSYDADLVVSPIILGELEYGILLLPASKKRKKLLDWFQHGVRRLNVVDFDRSTATAWATLLAELRRKGRAMPIKDSLVAASARQYGLTVATANTVDFRYAGVPLVNPFEA
jgi:toxin FitB